ncbi:MAG: glycerol-3-phosphate 1-O-acyltransferase PlsY [Rhodospirillales bacterium]|nr:glycerol-3-phosphate 1-O-acyltransferase PlsY [Rhodospirillales bacterium]
MPDPISWSYSWPYLATAFAAAYLLGSLPFGLILTRLAGLADIRSVGSGNIGATNVLRTGRNDLALATLLLDGGKGAIAVGFASWIWGSQIALVATFAVVLGHLFPIWLRFKGGKGVATTLGTLLALSFWIGALCCLTWLLAACIFRYSSLSALLAMALAPFYAWMLPWGFSPAEMIQPGFADLLFSGDLQLIQVTAALAILVWIRHWANIKRLLRSKEPKMGEKNT